MHTSADRVRRPLALTALLVGLFSAILLVGLLAYEGVADLAPLSKAAVLALTGAAVLQGASTWARRVTRRRLHSTSDDVPDSVADLAQPAWQSALDLMRAELEAIETSVTSSMRAQESEIRTRLTSDLNGVALRVSELEDQIRQLTSRLREVESSASDRLESLEAALFSLRTEFAQQRDALHYQQQRARSGVQWTEQFGSRNLRPTFVGVRSPEPIEHYYRMTSPAVARRRGVTAGFYHQLPDAYEVVSKALTLLDWHPEHHGTPYYSAAAHAWLSESFLPRFPPRTHDVIMQTVFLWISTGLGATHSSHEARMKLVRNLAKQFEKLESEAGFGPPAATWSPGDDDSEETTFTR